MGMLTLAKEIHGDIVPSCSELGWLGDPSGSQLAIYEMDRLPGENYIMARSSLSHDQRLNTVNSLARFVEMNLCLFPSCYPANTEWKVLCAVVAEPYAGRFERYIHHQQMVRHI
jgi:hypothetical protein